MNKRAITVLYFEQYCTKRYRVIFGSNAGYVVIALLDFAVKYYSYHMLNDSVYL